MQDRFYSLTTKDIFFLLGSLFIGMVGFADVPDFNRDVRPILSANCYACHGPDSEARKAKLRLDDRASALKKEAFVPGKPDDSELVYRVFRVNYD